MARLGGYRVIITGSSRGIGASIARKCAQEGARVAVTYSSNVDAAKTVFQSLPGSGHLLEQLEVSKPESVNEAFGRVIKEFGGIDGLVNNAGITVDQLLLRMKDDDFERVLSTNLKGVFLCSREVLKPMMKARRGSLVHITSIVGQRGAAGQSNYAASKAGTEGFSKSLALEMASRNIRSNCVAPGFIDTDMTAALDETQRVKIIQNIPLGFIGSGEDVANAVCFLLSDESRYVTGHTLSINGGLGM